MVTVLMFFWFHRTVAMVTSSDEHDFCSWASNWHLMSLYGYWNAIWIHCWACEHSFCSQLHTHVFPGCSRIQMADSSLTTSTIMCGTFGLMARTRRGIPSSDVSMALRPCWERQTETLITVPTVYITVWAQICTDLVVHERFETSNDLMLTFYTNPCIPVKHSVRETNHIMCISKSFAYYNMDCCDPGCELANTLT